MIGASDLNRLPRWTPSRSSEELQRYARSELGSETLHLAPAERSHEFLGIRAWLAARLRPSPAAARSPAKPLRTGVGAVHFAGDRGDPRPIAHPSAVFSTSPRGFPAHREDAESEELGSCNV